MTFIVIFASFQYQKSVNELKIRVHPRRTRWIRLSEYSRQVPLKCRPAAKVEPPCWRVVLWEIKLSSPQRKVISYLTLRKISVRQLSGKEREEPISTIKGGLLSNDDAQNANWLKLTNCAETKSMTYQLLCIFAQAAILRETIFYAS